MKVICPFCDSDQIEKIEVADNFIIPFSDDVIIYHNIYKCHNCEEEGDFDNSLEKALNKEIQKANRETVPKIMDELAQSGITMTYFEKALRLPFRTTSRWRSKHISHAALALLRLIRFSPPLLEVADDNFSPEAVAKYQISRTWDFFRENTNNPSYALLKDGNQVELGFSGNISSSNSTPSIDNVQWETVT